MIYEWYSGSDKKQSVPRGIREFSNVAEAHTVEERISFLSALLKKEQDPNWRAYLQHFIGCQYMAAGETQKGVTVLQDSLGYFDVFSANFRDVVEQYGRTMFYLLRESYASPHNLEASVELAFRVIPYLEQMDVDNDDRSEFWAITADVVLRLADRLNDSHLYRISAEFGLKAHHLDPDDPYVLEDLVYAFFGAGDVKRAKLAYKQIKDLKVDFEYRDRLDEFCKKVFSGKYVPAANDDHDDKA